MAYASTTRDVSSPRLSLTRIPTLTAALLSGGLIAVPLFIGASYAQVLTRAGFDLKRHAISMLTLGDQGWIQSANFEITGLLVLACALGMRRVLRSGRGSIWGPRLYGAYGLGLMVAGLFTPDPAIGFPPGAPTEMPADMSPHALLHTLGFMVSFASLIVACFVFARRFNGLGWRGWAVYSATTGLAPVPFIALSLALGGSGVPLFVMGIITSAWVAALPLRLLTSRATAAQA